jgi:hypothetical protein
MMMQQSRDAFLSFLLERGCSVDTVEPRAAALALIDWYTEARVEDAAAVDHDGDMLLLQWGTYDWGSGRAFEVDITRQLLLAPEEGDDAIWQLGLTFRYLPDVATGALAKGHQWCYQPSDAAEFSTLVSKHPVLDFTDAAASIERKLRLENAG